MPIRTLPFCSRCRGGVECRETQVAISSCSKSRGAAQKKDTKVIIHFHSKFSSGFVQCSAATLLSAPILSAQFNQSRGERLPPLLLLPVKNPTASKYIRRAGGRAGGGVLQGCRKNGWNRSNRLEFCTAELFCPVFSLPSFSHAARWSGRGTRTWSTRPATPIFSSPPTIISSSKRPGLPTRATTRVWPRTSWLAAGATRPPCSSTVGATPFRRCQSGGESPFARRFNQHCMSRCSSQGEPASPTWDLRAHRRVPG